MCSLGLCIAFPIKKNNKSLEFGYYFHAIYFNTTISQSIFPTFDVRAILLNQVVTLSQFRKRKNFNPIFMISAPTISEIHSFLATFYIIIHESRNKRIWG